MESLNPQYLGQQNQSRNQSMQKRGTFPDSDSAPSISPSPDPDSFTKTFDFSKIDTTNMNAVPHLSAALRTEKEFIDFMFSLPQIQKEAIEKGHGREIVEYQSIKEQSKDSEENLCGGIEEQITAPLTQMEKKIQLKPVQQGPATTRVGLDHLDNLCRMMEQLTDLKEQNLRLQRRVQYLEDLKTLQEMHRDMQESVPDRQNNLWVSPSSLSDSELRLDDLTDAPLSGAVSEDSLAAPSLVARINKQHSKGELSSPLLVEQHLPRHVTAEELSRHQRDLRDPRTHPSSDKEKKTHKSAWGKVKNMISSSKRDNIRKKSTLSLHRKTASSSSALRSSLPAPHTDPAPASDPEDYEVDYEGYASGDNCEDCPGDTGIWISSVKCEGVNQMYPPSINGRRMKPELAITVPPNENINQTDLSEMHDEYCEILQTPQQNSRYSNSNWSKVKQAFLTTQCRDEGSSLPSSPSKKISFTFDNSNTLGVGMGQVAEDSDSPLYIPELSPDDLLSAQSQSSDQTPSPQPLLSVAPSSCQGTVHSTTGAVQKNLADLQKTLTGEFNRKLQEWEKLKGQQLFLANLNAHPTPPHSHNNTEGNLPHEFKKKLHEWEKIKEKEKDKHTKVGGTPGRPQQIQPPNHTQKVHQEDNKTKKHGEDDLPPEFKKKLTEWEIGKVMVGKSHQNVEELQKNLGEEFNKKFAEWEKMKASGTSHMKSTMTGSLTQVPQVPQVPPNINVTHSFTPIGVGSPPVSTGNPLTLAELQRKGSASKIKKQKTPKPEKIPLVFPQTKIEGGHKSRIKEFQWLEKEIQKIEKEKQRLEREREKFLEREARLEKMQKAMRQGPVERKEIYIKTSTGEFRFEGISQTFTKKLYEWEERRGIRPESSTIALLDPNYQPNQETIKSIEPLKRLTRSKSESSIAEISIASPSMVPQQSSLSLNDHDQDDQNIHENKAASEPTLLGEDTTSVSSKSTKPLSIKDFEGTRDPDCSNIDSYTRRISIRSGTPLLGSTKVVYQDNRNQDDPYAPAEITRLIDSSDSEEGLLRQRRPELDDEVVTLISRPTSIRRSNSASNEASYRSLLHENMALLDRLRNQEDVCRALETKMGDIDIKMDHVADEHLKTLEKLCRQVAIMKDNSAELDSHTAHPLKTVIDNDALVEQLKAQIKDLELRGEFLMTEKEQLESAFKLHKEQESVIAESLVLRIRELQDAGSEVNIQDAPQEYATLETGAEYTIQDPEEDYNIQNPEVEYGIQESGQEFKLRDDSAHKLVQDSHFKDDIDGTKISIDNNLLEEMLSVTRETETENEAKIIEIKEELQDRAKKKTTDEGTIEKKIRRKRRKKEDVEYKEEDDEYPDASKPKEQKHRRRTPPKKVQKLHNLTGDLLFQAKMLEQALVTKHDLFSEEKRAPQAPRGLPRHRSLRGRNSLRLAGDAVTSVHGRRVQKTQDEQRTWSSIEALDTSQLKEHQNSTTQDTLQPQQILQMNAELSRMAKELRSEMTKMWSFRESTSPESMLSDCTEDLSRTSPVEVPSELQNENIHFEEEARQVFDSIRSLQKLSSVSSSSSSPKTTKDSEIILHGGSPDTFFNPSTFNDTHDDLSTKQRRNNNEPFDYEPNWYRKIRRQASQEDNYINFEETSKSSWLDQWEESNKLDHSHDDEINKDDWLSGWDTSESYVQDNNTNTLNQKIPSSSGITLEEIVRGQATINEHIHTYSSASSRSPSPCIMPKKQESFDEISLRNEIKRVFDNKDMDFSNMSPVGDDIGTWKSVGTHSSQQSEHVLSSSFEWEEEHNKYMPLDQYNIGNQTKRHLRQDDKLDEFILKNVHEGRPNEGDKEQYVTEVMYRPDVNNTRLQNLRLRRVSDTQVEYEDCQENAAEFYYPKVSRTVFDDEALSAGRVVRTPSFKKAERRGKILSKNAPWLNKTSLATYTSLENTSPVFVQTKRTIFTVQNEPTDFHKARATPTFVCVPDENNVDSNELKDDVQTVNFENSINKPKIVIMHLKSQGSSVDNSSNHSDEENDRITPLIDDKMGEIDYSSVDNDQLSPFYLNSSSYSAYFQSSSTSPPVESKKRVLEAVNSEKDPTVKNLIEAYNKRITESQELLSSPFKAPKVCNATPDEVRENSPSGKLIERYTLLSKSSNTNPQVLKSHSANAIPGTYPEPILGSIPPQVPRSSSGPLPYRKISLNTETLTEQLDVEISNLSKYSMQSDSMGSSMCTENDTSTDPDPSLDEALLAIRENTPSTSTTHEDSPSTKIRARRIKKAKEEFLSRGAAPLSIDKRHSGDFRLRTGTASTDTSSRDSYDFSGPTPSTSSQSPFYSNEGQIIHIRRQNSKHIPKNESFRRQSEGSLLEDRMKKNSPSRVLKSASSGIIGLYRPRASAEVNPSDRRQGFKIPHNGSKSSSSIFRFFKKQKDDKRDLTAVGKLCKQSFAINIAVPSSSKSVSPSIPDQMTNTERQRACSTLPRGKPSENTSTSTRSCPSSPVAQHRSKASAWIAKGKKLFKNRSPSPNKKE